jgi:hypothetical protein
MNVVETNLRQETFKDMNHHGVPIRIRNKDGFVNASRIAAQNDKEINNFMRTKRWKENLKNLKDIIPDVETLAYKMSGEVYVHPVLTHDIALWADKKYAVFVHEQTARAIANLGVPH